MAGQEPKAALGGVGIQMELSDTEFAVEQFSADIVVRNLETPTGGRVLIENQLEISDTTSLVRTGLSRTKLGEQRRAL